MKYLLILLFSVFIYTGCGGNEQPKEIKGKWEGKDTSGVTQVFSFKENNEASWQMKSSIFNMTFDINYYLDNSANPYKVKFSNFKEGPLAGKNLYCIIKFTDENTMKIDCEAAESDVDQSTAYPEDFTDETLILHKVKEQ